ncbi:hypothetical protein GCG21_09005 [Pseudactinotalea sp. HY160]|uniref:hypothetical protein n=1 Tax=Pseudactinotalea sp. HY160 TaxID=2654490 RepID=UPI00128CCDAF|nr:hypothetical protein [Pseudactinotalea sp. HY160]MPV50141.1 hypothetical protein [Pseudactinotalea sp. HY160]
MTHTNRSRQPAGTPTGGQFAQEARPAAGIGLEKETTEPVELGGVTTSMFIGDDGVPVVQIDTNELSTGEPSAGELGAGGLSTGSGRVRVNLNDGPPLYDGNPEQDEAPSVLGAGDVVALADVISMQQQQSRIRFLSGENEIAGTVRTGMWNADGDPERSDDVRTAHVRVTTSTGGDRFVPMTEMTRMMLAGELARDRR